MRSKSALLFIISAFILSCNKPNDLEKTKAESQFEAAVNYQSLLLDDLSAKFKVDTLGGSQNIDNSLMQFKINDTTYNHSNTFNYSLQTYLKWKEKYSQYKISVLFQGGNRFSFQLKDDYAITTVDVTSYPLNKINYIEFYIRSISL